eukprot:scaffold148111_cov48-Attheya_sp.AAC.3
MVLSCVFYSLGVRHTFVHPLPRHAGGDGIQVWVPEWRFFLPCLHFWRWCAHCPIFASGGIGFARGNGGRLGRFGQAQLIDRIGAACVIYRTPSCPTFIFFHSSDKSFKALAIVIWTVTPKLFPSSMSDGHVQLDKVIPNFQMCHTSTDHVPRGRNGLLQNAIGHRAASNSCATLDKACAPSGKCVSKII